VEFCSSCLEQGQEVAEQGEQTQSIDPETHKRINSLKAEKEMKNNVNDTLCAYGSYIGRRNSTKRSAWWVPMVGAVGH